MKTEDSLYTKILLWAYDKGDKGFSWEDLEKEFSLTPLQKSWFLKIFCGKKSSDDNLFENLDPIEGAGYPLVIASAGISAVINYRHLREVEESGGRAERIACVAITVGIIVGVLQIIIG